MRSKQFAAAVLIAAGAATAWAVPAIAEPDPGTPNDKQINEAFIAALRDERLPVKSSLKSEAGAIDLAHSTCNVLSSEGVNAALLHVQNATEWTNVDDLTTFGSLAVQAYCPGSAPE
jgi:hypothetical protein